MIYSKDNVVISTGDRDSLVEVYVLDGSFESKIKSIEQLSLFEVTNKIQTKISPYYFNIVICFIFNIVDSSDSHVQ